MFKKLYNQLEFITLSFTDICQSYIDRVQVFFSNLKVHYHYLRLTRPNRIQSQFYDRLINKYAVAYSLDELGNIKLELNLDSKTTIDISLVRAEEYFLIEIPYTNLTVSLMKNSRWHSYYHKVPKKFTKEFFREFIDKLKDEQESIKFKKRVVA